jgi:hypothetical protein
MIIHAFIRFCMVLNGTMCQELEIAPADHAIVSPLECMRGLMMGNNAEFTMNGVRWQIRGGTCRSVPSNLENIQAHLKERFRP